MKRAENSIGRDVRSPFGEWAQSVQTRLESEYECSRSILNQSALIGNMREAVVRRILAEFLPSSLEIGTGQIVDLHGVLSDQIDIVIARNDTPVFRFPGGMSGYLLETVLATIEVKSMLQGEKLWEALSNSKSVKDLTFAVHTRAKGASVFQETLDWVENNGGLRAIEGKILAPSLDRPLACPDDVWWVLGFVRFWLHWEAGAFRTPSVLQRLPDSLATADFDVFAHILCDILKERDPARVLCERFSTASSIKERFSARLYETLLHEQLPPNTFVLAYRGYEKLENLVECVRNWFKENREGTSWADMPRVIMNHKMFMYRHYNEYHCASFDCPAIFFMSGICSAITKNLSFPVATGTISQITRYFDIERILGDKHPKFGGDYLIWSIPFDGSSEGEVKAGYLQDA